MHRIPVCALIHRGFGCSVHPHFFPSDLLPTRTAACRNFLGFRHVAFAQHVGKSTLHTAVCKAAIGYGFCSLPELIPSILSATPDRGRAETWLLGFDLARTPSQGSEMTPARFIGAYGVFLLGKRGATCLQLSHAILASHE